MAFGREVMRSGRVRSALVAALAASGFALFVGGRALGNDPYASIYANGDQVAIIGTVTATVLVAEVAWFVALGVFARRGITLRPRAHLGVVTLEVTALSTALWAVGQTLDAPGLALALPSSLVYFPLVVLSAFFLSPRVVGAATALAVGQYLGVLALLGVPEGAPGPFGSLAIYLQEALLIGLTGAVAAVVAREARRRVGEAHHARGEHERVVGLWGRHLAPDLVRSILSGDPAPRVQPVAVLFLDVRGFTTFSEGRSPKEVVAFLNDLFEVTVGVVLAHGGLVHQLLGDGFMALFGVPDERPTAARDAVQAAVDIQRAVDTAVGDGRLPETRVGIGVHVGEALVGLVGTPSYREYKATGDVVNVAARIEGLNRDFGSSILVSEAAWEQAGLALPSGPVGPVTLRGRTEPLALRRLA